MKRIVVDDSIELIPLQECDGEELYNLIHTNRTYLREWLPWVDSTKECRDTQSFISRAQEQQKMEAGCHWGIWYKGRLTGVLGAHRIDRENKKAQLGYWLAEEFQKQGLMHRSCTAVLNYLFQEMSLNRVGIACAEGNDKSHAIPIRLGFFCEGLERAGELVDHEHKDLLQYSMLKKEWQGKKEQKETDIGKEEVHLRHISSTSLRDICVLSESLDRIQENMVAPNAVSIAEAYFTPQAWFRGIYWGDTPVGFVMLYIPDHYVAGSMENSYYLWRFMIGKDYQGRGIGKRALGLIVDHVRAQGANELYTSCVPGPGSPREFYIQEGFQPTGDWEEGEEGLILRLDT